jgi:thiol-disulfide isomerase/thioredoxin
VVSRRVRRLAWSALLILSGAIAGGAVWFTIVQKWFIGVFCPYCMATHITGLVLAALIIWRAPSQFGDDSTDVAPTNPALAPDGGMEAPAAPNSTTASVMGRRPIIGLALVGAALAGIMAAGQATLMPKVVFLGGESREKLSNIDPHGAPMIGSPDAPYVVKLLFDYKCPHCQQLHLMLEEAVRRYGGKLAFALCPTPLNTNCNPYIPRNVEEFADSCELAKVGLAVWVAKSEVFPAFDRWMFAFESGDRWQPRNLDAARAKAAELVGQAQFDAAWADPWIARYMQTCIRIYSQTIQNGNTAVPKLVFGSRWVIPEPNDVDNLLLILHDSVAVPNP